MHKWFSWFERLHNGNKKKIFLLGVGWLFAVSVVPSAYSLDLDWSGEFRTESHWLFNYSLDRANTTKNNNLSGYSIPGGGDDNAFFQTLFMGLRPVVIVNDNVYIKSEWWVGDPIFGLYGDSAPYTSDQRQYYSTQSRGSVISAQRFWGEFLTDFGTVQLGRAPLHWGLGLFWHSGDGIWDRYHSTGDVVRLVSKFGSFTFTPAIIKYNIGNNLGGACANAANPDGVLPSTCATTNSGGGELTDYSLAFEYENPDEDLKMGLNFIKRIAGSAQDVTSGVFGIQGVPAGSNYTHWDIFGRKKVGDFTLAGELPITNGDVGGVEYRTWAIALEVDWEMSDMWQTFLKGGHIPGQPDYTGTSPAVYEAYFLNPNYNIGLVMFNYQLRNFAGPNTTNNPNTGQANVVSPFDNPIVNANYLAAGGALNTAKWTFRSNLVFAVADETAGSGANFFNYWTRSFEARNDGSGLQSSSLGWEMDFGSTFRWDESFRFDLDFGWWFPGGFYSYNNTGNATGLSPLFATVFKVGVTF